MSCYLSGVWLPSSCTPGAPRLAAGEVISIWQPSGKAQGTTPAARQSPQPLRLPLRPSTGVAPAYHSKVHCRYCPNYMIFNNSAMTQKVQQMSYIICT